MIPIRQSNLKSVIIKSRKNLYRIISVFLCLLIFMTLTGAGCNIQGLLGLGDPTTSTTDIASMRDKITGAVIKAITWLTDAAGAIGTIYFMYSGFIYMTALGDKEKIEKAKKGMLWSVIGVIILLLSSVAVHYAFKDILKVSVTI